MLENSDVAKSDNSRPGGSLPISPEDLKNIPQEKLPFLCSEIRELIINTVSKNGGHIAPSLGVVELATALHYVFESPNDKIIWDVGHQSYAHKILTGRGENFSTLRQVDGISGFPKMEESVHDAFGTGHSSTSISAALGIAEAFKKRGIENRAIAVIGDGSMTSGLAFEGLNQAGHKAGNLIVVLNDNEMSISPSVGALSRFLSVHLYGKTGRKVRRKLKKLLLLIPIWGKQIYKLTQRAEEATLSFFTPGFLFEAFGFDYIGPLDGHNIDNLIQVFQGIKALPIGEKPLLVHVLTKKGKGYAPAEADPTQFHGTGPFDRATGKTLSSGKISYTDAFSDAMIDVATRNDKVMGITAAMATGTGLDRFAKEYPDRFFDVGLAEGHAVTFAAGLVTQGYRPVVAVYSTFLQRAYDQIVHDVCLQNLPVTFAIDRAGFVGDDGPTHNGLLDISYMRPMPNMTILAPRDARMLKEMLFFATGHDGPVAIRYPRGQINSLSSPSLSLRASAKQSQDHFTPARAEVVYHSQNPVATIWAVGHLVFNAITAAKSLAEEGIEVTVVDPRSIKPFDFELFRKFIEACPNVITVEENFLAGGFGSMIAEWLVKEGVSDVRLKCLGVEDVFTKHAPQQILRAKSGIDANGIIRTVRTLYSSTIADGIPETITKVSLPEKDKDFQS